MTAQEIVLVFCLFALVVSATAVIVARVYYGRTRKLVAEISTELHTPQCLMRITLDPKYGPDPLVKCQRPRGHVGNHLIDPDHVTKAVYVRPEF